MFVGLVRIAVVQTWALTEDWVHDGEYEEDLVKFALDMVEKIEEN